MAQAPNPKGVAARLLNPWVAVPAGVLAHAGLSAYGNALAQNELEKSDARLVLESAMAGLGAGAAGLAARRLIVPAARRGFQAMQPAQQAQIRAVLAANPEINNLRAYLPGIAGVAGAGMGAGFAGGILAPFIAGNLNLLGVPGWSGRQQDFYEQDQSSAPLAKADLQAIQELMP